MPPLVLSVGKRGLVLEGLICLNYNMTFVMIIQDFGGQTGTFLTKYAYFELKVTFYPYYFCYDYS